MLYYGCEEIVMQDRVQTLLEAAESLPTYFLQYTRTRARCGKLPIFVFEGVDDPKYYTPRIDYRFGGRWRPLSIKGKSNVISLRNDIKQNPAYSNDKVGFIVDKDFDDSIVGCDIYTTPCYSVENIYLADSTIRNLLTSAGGLSNNTEAELEAIDYVLELYNNYKSKYEHHRRTKRMNLAFLYIRKELADKKISLNKLFQVSHKLGSDYNFSIKDKKDLAELKKTKIDSKNFKEFVRKNHVARNILSGNGEFYRGKQQLLFLREFVIALKSTDKAFYAKIKKETGVRVAFKKTNLGADILSDLSAVATTPPCLSDFLDNFFGK